MSPDRTPLVVALDSPDRGEIESLCRELSGLVAYFKVGLEPFTALGPEVFSLVRPYGEIFFDCKLHDIPRTVRAAVREAARHGVGMLNIHALGGRQMMTSALEGAAEAGGARPLVIAVTVLTSLSSSDLAALGFAATAPGPGGGAHELGRTVALHLAREAQVCGLDGVVAAAEDAPVIKRACGDDFLVVSPGIRPAGAAVGDQKRIATPRGALEMGADLLVVGRPIVEAPDPRGAAQAILQEITSPT